MIMMAKIKNHIGKDGIREATNLYIGDILVGKTVKTEEKVISHLKFGVVAKSLESIEVNAALGLWIRKDKVGTLYLEVGMKSSRKEKT